LNLSITQQPINGILGGPKHKDFAVSVNNIAFNISIDQQCQLNTPGRMVQADRAGGACVPLKWCTAAAAMVH
jgi:hypothetical protein